MDDTAQNVTQQQDDETSEYLTPQEKQKRALEIHDKFDKDLEKLYLDYIDELDEIKKHYIQKIKSIYTENNSDPSKGTN